ncbi:MAG: YihY/virulence factor BrkB family protein [Gammaproteobacteria bacterium]|nr:YihY/virulence factor BrkB family protein [Gammaproteobacteria bacterium]MBU1490592.1 YihY/virulence factor BrkB family protein [Gammaproteobacteria bacterium]MBU2137433.1 YihY/virulence factor BrkB family protein [Gammaproteobacteria bacterium]MBU2218368.1 YihY/virulence factor BrkB family protein [Gammaproteobacteria bacterium]MBU2321903.1 YihY/virulence factor BrkB family protein [Gammaproteobacteria bacterium]
MLFPRMRVGWFTVLKTTVQDFIEDELPTYASALAFQLFFSLFPFLLFLIALISVLDMQPFFDWLRQQAELVMPQAALDLVNPAIDQLQTQQAGLFSVGILVALWTASSAVRSVMDATNKAYGVKEGRPAWKRIPLSLLYTLAIAATLLTAAAFMVLGPQVLGWLAHYIGIEQAVITLWSWVRWPLIVMLMMVAVAGVYYVAPDVEQEFRFITPGSVLAVVVWIAASMGFGYYAQNYANYNATYGSIGAIIIFLLYLYISSAVLLFGAELNAVIEHSCREGKDMGEKVAQPAD